MTDEEIFAHFQDPENRRRAMAGKTEQDAGDVLDVAALRAAPEGTPKGDIERTSRKYGVSVIEWDDDRPVFDTRDVIELGAELGREFGEAVGNPDLYESTLTEVLNALYTVTHAVSLSTVLSAYVAESAVWLWGEIDPDGTAETVRDIRLKAFDTFHRTIAVEDLDLAVYALAVANSNDIARVLLAADD